MDRRFLSACPGLAIVDGKYPGFSYEHTLNALAGKKTGGPCPLYFASRKISDATAWNALSRSAVFEATTKSPSGLVAS